MVDNAIAVGSVEKHLGGKILDEVVLVNGYGLNDG